MATAASSPLPVSPPAIDAGSVWFSVDPEGDDNGKEMDDVAATQVFDGLCDTVLSALGHGCVTVRGAPDLKSH